MECPVCLLPLLELEEHEREQHVNAHFEDAGPDTSEQEQRGQDHSADSDFAAALALQVGVILSAPVRQPNLICIKK
jgi:hypothetical protein